MRSRYVRFAPLGMTDTEVVILGIFDDLLLSPILPLSPPYIPKKSPPSHEDENESKGEAIHQAPYPKGLAQPYLRIRGGRRGRGIKQIPLSSCPLWGPTE